MISGFSLIHFLDWCIEIKSVIWVGIYSDRDQKGKNSTIIEGTVIPLYMYVAARYACTNTDKKES